jgi:hypothetical protein
MKWQCVHLLVVWRPIHPRSRFSWFSLVPSDIRRVSVRSSCCQSLATHHHLWPSSYHSALHNYCSWCSIKLPCTEPMNSRKLCCAVRHVYKPRNCSSRSKPHNGLEYSEVFRIVQWHKVSWAVLVCRLGCLQSVQQFVTDMKHYSTHTVSKGLSPYPHTFISVRFNLSSPSHPRLPFRSSNKMLYAVRVSADGRSTSISSIL